MVLLLAAAAFGFGAAYALSDLLSRRGHRWFPWARPIVAGIAATLAVGMLWLGPDALHLFWVAALGSWLLRGRQRAVDAWVVTAAMVGYLATRWPIMAVDPYTLPFFAVPLLLLGVGADLLGQRGGAGGRLLTHIVERRLHWYAIAAGFSFWFGIEPGLYLAMMGFMQGESALRSKVRAGALRSWGLRSPD